MPANSEQLFNRFCELGICYETHSHPALARPDRPSAPSVPSGTAVLHALKITHSAPSLSCATSLAVSRPSSLSVLAALNRAIAVRDPAPGLIHHSDRGSQYCSYDYQRLLKAHHMIPSMSGKGNCYDNAMVETVFKTIKSELVWRTRLQSRQHAENAIGRYIDGFYNPTRRHSALGYQSPIAFEAIMAETEPTSLY